MGGILLFSLCIVVFGVMIFSITWAIRGGLGLTGSGDRRDPSSASPTEGSGRLGGP